jgi:hypothetical protein
MEIILSILGVVLKAVFGIVSSSMESSAKSEAEAERKRADAMEASYASERKIEKAVREVPKVDIDPSDIFGARAAAAPR